MKLKKTSFRRLLYLIATVIIGLIALAVSNARLAFYKENDKAKRAYLSIHLKQDTEKSMQVFDARYRLDSDYLASRKDKIRADFLSVCQDGCDLLRGINSILKICNKLSKSSYKFNQYRVYDCHLTATLENDQPLICDPMNHQDFKELCGLMTASL